MGKSRILISAGLVTVLVAIAGAVGTAFSATPIYVNAATGNDAWSGTIPTPQPPGNPTDGPKKTIQAGVDAVDDNGTVHVAAGTYAEHVHITKVGVQLLGAGASSTTIDARQGPSWPVAKPGILIEGPKGSNPGASGIRVSGFTIKDAENDTNGNPFGGALYGTGPGGMAGVQIYGSSSNIIENCIVERCGWGIWIVAEWAAGGYGHSANNLIRYNTLNLNRYDGIYLYTDSSRNITGTTIRGNQVTADGNQNSLGIRLQGSTTLGGQVSSTTLDNNTLTNCGNYAIAVRYVTNWHPLSFTGINKIQWTLPSIPTGSAAKGLLIRNTGGAAHNFNIGATQFAAGLTEFIRLISCSQNVDATSAWFQGCTTTAQIEAKLLHKPDNPALGLISYRAATRLYYFGQSPDPGISDQPCGVAGMLEVNGVPDTAGRPVSFICDQYSAVANTLVPPGGIATWYIPANSIPPGTYTVYLWFAGDAQAQPAVAVGTMTMNAPVGGGPYVVGSGWFSWQGKRNTTQFNFDASQTAGTFVHLITTTRTRYESTGVTSITLSEGNNKAVITGTCTKNGAGNYTYTLTVYDSTNSYQLSVSDGFSCGPVVVDGDISIRN